MDLKKGMVVTLHRRASSDAPFTIEPAFVISSNGEEVPVLTLLAYNLNQEDHLSGPDWPLAFERITGVQHEDHPDVEDGKVRLFYSDRLLSKELEPLIRANSLLHDRINELELERSAHHDSKVPPSSNSTLGAWLSSESAPLSSSVAADTSSVPSPEPPTSNSTESNFSEPSNKLPESWNTPNPNQQPGQVNGQAPAENADATASSS